MPCFMSHPCGCLKSVRQPFDLVSCLSPAPMSIETPGHKIQVTSLKLLERYCPFMCRLHTRTYRLRARREAQGIAAAIATPINAGCGWLVCNPQGRGVCSASLCRSSLIWSNQTSFLAPCAASANAAVATVRNSEIGSSTLSGVIHIQRQH